jgi:hypothetical protein
MAQRPLTEPVAKAPPVSAVHEPTREPARTPPAGSRSAIFELQRSLGNHHVAHLIESGRLTSQGSMLHRRVGSGADSADDQYVEAPERATGKAEGTPDPAAAIVLQEQACVDPSGSRAQVEAAPVQAKPPNSPTAAAGARVQRQNDLGEEVDPQEKQEDKGSPLKAKQFAAPGTTYRGHPAGYVLPSALATAPDAPADSGRLELPAVSGAPLPHEHREAFEEVLGQSLGHVRVHTGSAVDQAAHQIHADAFTVGSDVYLTGSYANFGQPDTDRVVAHELTHVVQHDEGRIPEIGSGQDAVSDPSDPLEVEAYAQEQSVADAATRLRQGASGGGGAMRSASTVDADAFAEAAQPDRTAVAHGVVAWRTDLLGAKRPIARKEDEQAMPQSGAGPSDAQFLKKVPAPPSPLKAGGAPSAAEAPARPSPGIAAPKGAAGMPLPNAGKTVRAPPTPAPKVPPSKATARPTGASPVEGPAMAGAATSPGSERPEFPQPAIAPPVPTASAERPGTTGAAAAAAAAQADNIVLETQALGQALGPRREAALTALNAEVARLIERAHEEAAEARAGLAAAYGDQQAALQMQAQASLDAIEQTRQQQRQAVADIAAQERGRLLAAQQTERQSAVDGVEALKPAIVAAGETQAERVGVQSETNAATILAEAQAVPAAGEPPVVEAQRKAALEIAERAAEQCRETGTEMAGQVREEAASYAANDFDSGLQDYLEQLEEQVAEAEVALEEFTSEANAQVDAVAAQAADAVRELAAEGVAALDSDLSAAQGQVDAWEAQVPGTVEAGNAQLQQVIDAKLIPFNDALTGYGATAAAQVRALAGSAPEAIEAGAAQVRQNLQAAHDAMIGGVGDWQASSIADLGAGFEEVLDPLHALVEGSRAAVELVGGQLGQGLQQVSQSAGADMEAAAASFQGRLGTGIDDAIQQMTAAGDDMRAKMQENQAAVTAALVQVVDDALAGEDNLLADARGEMAAALPEIAGKFQELQTEAQRRNEATTSVPSTRIHRGIWSSITDWVSDLADSIKTWFADTFGEFWGGLIYGILETLVIVVVGAVTIWLVATGIGALIVALGYAAVATSTIAAIIGAVLLVLVIVPLMIYNRVLEYRQDNPGKDIGIWTGIGLGLLGIADVTGIPFIIEAAAGQRITGGELHGWERGFRLGQGIVMLGTVLFGAYRFFKGSGPKPVPAPEKSPVVVDPNAKPVVDPNAPPVVDPNAPPELRPPEVRPPEIRPPEPYDPALRTDAELLTDLDPLPRAGETPAEAQARVNRAQIEIDARRAQGIHDQLGAEPPRLDMRLEDANPDNANAHTTGRPFGPNGGRHDPGIPLERTAAPPGDATIEGRIYGDAPWTRPENSSFKWFDDPTLNNAVNDYIQANWELIRNDLALDGAHNNFVRTGNAVGEGYINENMNGAGPRLARYMVTSNFRITILPKATAPYFYVITTFPAIWP